jgi:3-hydroxyisobutyrate dehydrogenase-like beta-hydroxyacid dehydrogenase
VVGLGNIGRGMAAALNRVGHPYIAYDVNPAAADAIEPAPRMAATLRDLASECPLVGVCVFDEGQVRDVLFGVDGLLAAGRDDLTVTLRSTSTVSTGLPQRTFREQMRTSSWEPLGARSASARVTAGREAASASMRRRPDGSLPGRTVPPSPRAGAVTAAAIGLAQAAGSGVVRASL